MAKLKIPVRSMGKSFFDFFSLAFDYSQQYELSQYTPNQSQRNLFFTRGG